MEGVPSALLPLIERPDRSALFCDFDGTLAAIVAEPARARPLPGVGDLLAGLARRLGLVAVVSGRPVEFLVEHLAAPGVRLVGLYGLEWVGAGGRVVVHDEAPAVAADARGHDRARPGGRAEGGARRAQGVDGHAALARHPRGGGLGARLLRRRAPARRPRRPARRACPSSWRRRSRWTRAPSCARLGAGFAAVACFGDDLGDLEAFAALDDLGAAGAAVARVAVVDDESPPAVAAAADVVVAGPEGAVALLSRLLGP